MTEARRLELEEKLNMAEASGDAAAIAAVKKTMEHEYRECTSHTADRLKRVEKTVNEIKEGLIPAELFTELKESLRTLSDTVHMMKADIEAWKNKAQGMKLLWRILTILTSVCGGGVIMKLLTSSAKATSNGGLP